MALLSIAARASLRKNAAPALSALAPFRAMSSSSSDVAAEFERKVALGKKLPPLDDNASKLQMYSLFKQANVGKNTTAKPGMLDFVGKAKWDAWTKLGDMSKEEAMQKYIAIIDDLARQNGVDPSNPDAAVPAAAPVGGASDDLLVTTSDAGLLTIQLNRAPRHNAINRAMYNGIIEALESSASNSSVKAVLIKSAGATFSSGNDLSMFTATTEGQSFEGMAEEGATLLERFVNAFVQYPKPVVAAVQGPAVGIAVTVLALCDLVYVSEAATIHTPFTALGQSPEACSSVLFPRIMGTARANAMLLLGEKMDAHEAVTAGFATGAFGVADFDTQVQSKVDLLLSRYPNSMKQSKSLIRSPAVIAELQEINRRECDVLKKMWLGAECMDAILKFQSRKK